MPSKSLFWLAILARSWSWASPVPDPRNVLNLREAAGNVGRFAQYFPDCSMDPSYSVGKSAYEDGSGIYVTSSCDNGLFTPGAVQWHCWTDLYVVNYQASYSDWVNTGQVIDCNTTSSCAEATTIALNSTCTTSSTTWDNTLGGAIEAQLPLWFNQRASTTLSFTYDRSFGGAKDEQICSSKSDTSTCTWSDKACHAVWSAQRNIQVNGYLRRSCNTPRHGTNVPDSQRRPDGYYTVGMQDYSFQVPENRLVGCAAGCGDITYPDPTPGSDPVTPFSSS